MGAGAGGKKQREVYVGNLTIGSVNDVMLKELFNGALAHLMPDAATNPPVVNVAMDPSGVDLCAVAYLSLSEGVKTFLRGRACIQYRADIILTTKTTWPDLACPRF